MRYVMAFGSMFFAQGGNGEPYLVDQIGYLVSSIGIT